MLVHAAVAARRWTLDTPLSDLLPNASRLSGITLRHLLEHRHGLDDSLLASVPRSSVGTIDTASLIEALDGRLFAPGMLYSYSNAGAWLCAAVLQRWDRRSFRASLLGLSRAQHLGLVLADRSAVIDPAVGGELTVSLASLLRFARRAVDATFWRDAGRAHPLPGWNAIERGVLHGFKNYGGGWFGHQSARPGASVWLLMHPRRRIAIVVDSGRHPALLIALRLFSRRLPGLALRRAPPPVTATGLSAIAGRYGSKGQRVTISVRPDQPPVLEYQRHSAELQAAQDGIFFADAATHRDMPFVQFVSAADGSGPYLWNGHRIYPRIA